MRKIEEIEKDLAGVKTREAELEEERKENIREERRKRHAEIRRQTEELKARLEVEHGVVGNPKADLLWSKAWERGHAYGFTEVESVYSDLVELIQ